MTKNKFTVNLFVYFKLYILQIKYFKFRIDQYYPVPLLKGLMGMFMTCALYDRFKFKGYTVAICIAFAGIVNKNGYNKKDFLRMVNISALYVL